jgi:hypothetical protein
MELDAAKVEDLVIRTANQVAMDVYPDQPERQQHLAARLKRELKIGLDKNTTRAENGNYILDEKGLVALLAEAGVKAKSAGAE